MTAIPSHSGAVAPVMDDVRPEAVETLRSLSEADIAEAINKARYTSDSIPYRSLEESSYRDRDYCDRLARGVMALVHRTHVLQTPAAGVEADGAGLDREAVRSKIQWAIDTLYEINTSNYDHDEVERLNNASVEVTVELMAFLENGALATKSPASARGSRERAAMVCVSPSGEPHWPSVKPTEVESRRACFGVCNDRRTEELTREGWRCLPVFVGWDAPASGQGEPADAFGAHVLTGVLGRIGDREIGPGHVVLSEDRYQWLRARASGQGGGDLREACRAAFRSWYEQPAQDGFNLGQSAASFDAGYRAALATPAAPPAPEVEKFRADPNHVMAVAIHHALKGDTSMLERIAPELRAAPPAPGGTGQAQTQAASQALGWPDGDVLEMVTADNRRMRAAGLKLSEAALHVIREYDGLHRLCLAVAGWATAIADEGLRAEMYGRLPCPDPARYDRGECCGGKCTTEARPRPDDGAASEGGR